MHRFFSSEDFYPGKSIILEKEEMHHLKHVMRIGNGSLIELVNGKGALATALVDTQITISTVDISEPSTHKSILIQGLTEPQNLELIVEKGTEIGITDFWIFIAEKSKHKQISPSKQERLSKILRSSLKQSKRLYLPNIAFFPSIKAVPKTVENIYIADPRASKQIPHPSTDRAIIVGPESGLTQNEVSYAEKELKATRILLSPNILRTETAAIIASFLIADVANPT